MFGIHSSTRSTRKAPVRDPRLSKAEVNRSYALLALMAPYEGAGKVLSLRQFYFGQRREAMPISGLVTPSGKAL